MPGGVHPKGDQPFWVAHDGRVSWDVGPSVLKLGQSWANQLVTSFGLRKARAFLKCKGANIPGGPWTSGGRKLVGNYSPSWSHEHMIPRCLLHASSEGSEQDGALWPTACCVVLVIKLCLTCRNPMDCSLPGSYVHGISQARILEWAVISSSRGSS